MSFDPTKPVEDSPLDAAEMRGQLNALKGLIDALQAQITSWEQQLAAFAPVLTANNATMSLEWAYSGPACDGFHIFIHQAGEAPGIFNDRAQVGGDARIWATGFDVPTDATGYAYYIVPMDGDGNALTPATKTVSFAAG